MQFLTATPPDDSVINQQDLAVWNSYLPPAEHLKPDHEEVVRSFMSAGRQEKSLASFEAFDGTIPAGSCTPASWMPYPHVIKPELRLQG
jgi:hypothetical protein